MVRSTLPEGPIRMDEIDTSGGLVSLCAWCKRARDRDNIWREVEDYSETDSRVTFSHAICPDCARKIDSRTADDSGSS